MVHDYYSHKITFFFIRTHTQTEWMLNEKWCSNAPLQFFLSFIPVFHIYIDIYTGHCILLFEQNGNVSIDSAYLQVFDLMRKSTRLPDRG